MKKINSIDYGAKVICVGLFFLVPLPGALYGLNRLFHSSALTVLFYISLGAGALIELSFLVLLLIEARQDKIINAYYQNNPSSLKTPQEILSGRGKRKTTGEAIAQKAPYSPNR